MNAHRHSRSGSLFSGVLYAHCWEDPSMDRAAFRAGPGDTIFTITSGGCNALTFLLDDPAKVICLDLNPHQNYLLELKCAAIRSLSYDDLLEFVGVHSSSARHLMYQTLRHHLSSEAREFWDRHRRDVARGIMHCGRFERYMRLLGMLTRLLVGRKTVLQMFQTDDPRTRERLYDSRWRTRRWDLFTRIFLGRRFMSVLFDPGFFAQLEKRFSFGEHFERIVRNALVNLRPGDSWFLSYALLGRYYSPEQLPEWLVHENVAVIRQRLGRLELVAGDCLKYFRTLPSGSVTRFNFTNIFEWMDAGTFEAILREAVRIAPVGAILTYRNLLVPRSCPDTMQGSIVSHGELARRLHAHDRSFLYTRYVIEEIARKDMAWVSSSAA